MRFRPPGGWGPVLTGTVVTVFATAAVIALSVLLGKPGGMTERELNMRADPMHSMEKSQNPRIRPMSEKPSPQVCPPCVCQCQTVKPEKE